MAKSENIFRKQKRIWSVFLVVCLLAACNGQVIDNSSLPDISQSENSIESEVSIDSQSESDISVSESSKESSDFSDSGSIKEDSDLISSQNSNDSKDSISTSSSENIKATPTPGKMKQIELDFENYYKENNNSFSRALSSAIADAQILSSQEKKTGNDFRIIINVTKRSYTINFPIAVSDSQNIIINGNGSTVINKSKMACININKCTNVSFTNFTFDYDPLPFTQGEILTIESPKGGQSVITLKVDSGYNTDAANLSSHESIFNIHDRTTMAPAEGSRQFYSVSKVESLENEVLKITLGWGINDAGAGQKEVKTGDIGVLRPFNGQCAINVFDSSGTEFKDFTLHSAPAFGLKEEGGEGGMKFTRFNIVPGPKPSGAAMARLSSVNRDATHFISTKNGPEFQDCKLMNSGDDVINVHGFYYFAIKKISDRRYYLTPKWDIGMANGDSTEILDKNSFNKKANAKIIEFKKITANNAELREAVEAQWGGSNRSASAVPSIIYDVTFDKPVSIEIGDAVTSLDRIGRNTIVNNCTFHGGGRVNIKGINAVITNNRFSYTLLTAIHIGSDIGYWAESHYADKVLIKNNKFDHCGVSANPLFDKEVNGSIYVSMTAPLYRTEKTFFNNYMNRNVTIEGNTITNSYYYGIVLTNADNAVVKNNIIREVFLNSPYIMGSNYMVSPEAGILIAQTRNSIVSGNIVSSKMNVWEAIDLEGICSGNSITGNILE